MPYTDRSQERLEEIQKIFRGARPTLHLPESTEIIRDLLSILLERTSRLERLIEECDDYRWFNLTEKLPPLGSLVLAGFFYEADPILAILCYKEGQDEYWLDSRGAPLSQKIKRWALLPKEPKD